MTTREVARRWVIRIGAPAYRMYLMTDGPNGAGWSYDLGNALRFITADAALAVAQRTQRWLDSVHRDVVEVAEVPA